MSLSKLVIASKTDLNPQIDWDKCVVCQRDGDLICSARNAVASKRNIGYKRIAPSLEELKSFPLYRLPCGLKVHQLDEGEGIEATLTSREAKWHKNCARRFLPPMFESLKARLTPEVTSQPGAGVDEPDETAASSTTDTPVRVSRRSSAAVQGNDPVCVFCNEGATRKYPLHLCSTDNITGRVRECAQVLGDFDLQAKLLTAGDLHAQDAMYHLHCLTRLYNRERAALCKFPADTDLLICESMAFADMMSYVTMRLTESINFVFKMGDLLRLYNARLSNLLGPDVEVPPAHSTRMKEKILARIPDLTASLEGRDIVLRHTKANFLSNVLREDQDDDALGFRRFVKRLRGVMSSARLEFDGSFAAQCEEKSVPAPVLGAVNMLLYGSKFSSPCGATRPALTIAQLLMTNFRETMPRGNIVRHQRHRETPFPLYAALSAYGNNRDKSQIDEMHRLGVSVSHNRVMEVTSQLCRMVVQRADEEKVLCPANLGVGVMTVAAFDNIDFKGRSTTAKDEFHGTGMSVFQLPMPNDSPVARSFQTSYSSVEQRGVRTVPRLPAHYYLVDENFSINDKVELLPLAVGGAPPQALRPEGNFCIYWKKEGDWLKYAHEQLEGSATCSDFSWGAFYATREHGTRRAATNALLPLFEEKSTSPGMIKHGIDLISRITRLLKPGQTPVLCMDQPLYALAKKLQWMLPAAYGEDRVVMLLGPFHIEKSFLTIIGSVMEKCGWVEIVAASGNLSAGSAEAILKVTNVVRSRVEYQKTAIVLHSLLMDAYDEQNPDHGLTLDEWIVHTSESSPTFHFWIVVLNLISLLLTFLRSLRQGKYELFVRSLADMLPWYFLFDRQNYARWLTVHLKDLVELAFKAPEIHQYFKAGNFVVNKTGRPFSSIAIDQAHEQNNKCLKDKGGVVGLTCNSEALRRVMIAGPEVARLLQEFQSTSIATDIDTHHEEYDAYQISFKNECRALKESFLSFENPFCVLGPDLIALDSREVARAEGLKALHSLEITGEQKFKEFVDERILSANVSIHQPIRKNQIKIFAGKKKPLHLENRPALALKANNQLFWRLYVSSVARKLDINKFFEFENQSCPPALSKNGKLTSGNKAELLKILESLVEGTLAPSKVDGLVYDGAGLVHTCLPRSRSFQDYVEQILSSARLLLERLGAVRVDFVWDLYTKHSLKSTERESRGEGVRKKDLPEKGALPKDWDDYLKNEANKRDLFKYLATAVLTHEHGFRTVTNVLDNVEARGEHETIVSNEHCHASEEADGRIITHVLDMAKKGMTSVLIRASDTDVVVLAVSLFNKLAENGLKELWILFGAGNKIRYIPAHLISAALGSCKSEALRGFHAFTGCDTTSYFAGCKKKRAWNTWMAHEQVTDAFRALGQPLAELSASTFAALERFTVLMYDPSSTALKVDSVRMDLFISRNKSLFLIPPTRAALHQHSLRAAYQAGHVWGRCASIQPGLLPEPSSWGWAIVNDQFKPFWTALPDMWAACRSLDTCGCKTPCATMRCGCRASDLSCCPGCTVCKGKCSNKSSRMEDVSDADENEDDPNLE